MHDEKYLVKLGMLPRANNTDQILKLTHKFLESDKKRYKKEPKNSLILWSTPIQNYSKLQNYSLKNYPHCTNLLIR